MDASDVEAAFAAGRIDPAHRRRLLGCLAEARRLSRAAPELAELVGRARVVGAPETDGNGCDVLRSLESIPGAAQRPGMVALFRDAHRGGMQNFTDVAELEKVGTFEQLHAMVRVETQPALASAIRDVWQPMQNWFDRGAIVIPRRRSALRAPPGAERANDDGSDLAVLPLSREFSGLFESNTSAVTLALLKRVVERMGRHFTDRWCASSAAQSPAVKRAERLLRMLRNVELRDVLANGFASGVSDVLNPLHVLVRSVLAQQGPAAFTSSLRQAIVDRHVEFSIFLATFSLPCLAELESILRQPAPAETRKSLLRWSAAMPDFGGKGYTLDCEYNPAYFTVRSPPEETSGGAPLIDFHRPAFSDDEIARIASRMIRLGCPSLGQPLRQFTRYLCDAWFAVVLPQIIAEQAPLNGS